MDQKRIQDLIDQVFKSWTPDEILVEEAYTRSVRLLVISNRFQDLGLEARLALVKNQLKKENLALEQAYLWSIQPYTFAEAQGLRGGNQDDDGPSYSPKPLKKSASPEAP